MKNSSGLASDHFRYGGYSVDRLLTRTSRDGGHPRFLTFGLAKTSCWSGRREWRKSLPPAQTCGPPGLGRSSASATKSPLISVPANNHNSMMDRAYKGRTGSYFRGNSGEHPISSSPRLVRLNFREKCRGLRANFRDNVLRIWGISRKRYRTLRRESFLR